MKKLFKDNKGIAMMTVMIATTFIAILSASLLYMAYMNYLTKVMRYGVTDTFYTDEYALDDLSSSMQQLIVDKNAKNLAEAKQIIYDACVGGGGTPVSGKYNGDEMEKLLRFAITDRNIQEINIDTIADPSDDNFIIEKNSIIFKDLSITTTTVEGYSSTINLDLELEFPGTGSGDFDVNSFSVITSQPIKADSGNSSFAGNLYISDGDNKPNVFGDALVVGNGSQTCTMSIMSTRALIDGNIVIKKNSTLMIGGNVSVTGKVDIQSGGTLIVSGKCVAKGGKTGSGILVGKVDSDSEMNLNEIPNSILEGLFTSVYVYESGTWKEYDNYMKFFQAKGNSGLHNQDTVSGSGDDDSDSEDYACQINMETSSKTLVNTLCFNNTNCVFQGNKNIMGYINSTILSAVPMDYTTTQDGKFFTHMNKLAYEKCKAHCITADSSLSGMSLPNTADASISYIKAHYKDSGVVYKSYTDVGGESRTVMYKDGYMYLPFGYFIRSDSSEYLSKIMNSVLDKTDPTVTVISYSNWSKE